MLLPLAILFFLFWAIALVVGYTLGGFIHLFLILAVIFLLAHIIGQGRNATGPVE